MRWHMRGLWLGLALSLALLAYGLSGLPGHLLVAAAAGVPLVYAWRRRLQSERAVDVGRLAAAADVIADPIVVTDLDNNVAFVNQALEQLAGAPATDLLGRPLQAALKDKQLALIGQQALAGERGPFPRVHPFGLSFEVSASAVHDHGRPIGMVATFRSMSPPSYEYRESPLPRPRSTVSLNELFTWFFPSDSYGPDDPQINEVAHKCRRDPAYAGSHGLSGSAELETGKALYTLVRLLKPDSVIEIGSYTGASSICIAQALSDNSQPGLLHCVEIDEKHVIMAQKHLEEAALAHRVRFYQGSSHDPGIVHSLPRSEIIFVDGDHTYHGARKDFEIYSGLLADHGVIVYHDTIKIMALQKLMTELAQNPQYDTFTIATSDGDGLTLIRRRTPDLPSQGNSIGNG